MERYRRTLRSVLYLFFSLLAIVIGFVVLRIYVSNYNKEDRRLEYPLRYSNNDISVNVACRNGVGSTWEKWIPISDLPSDSVLKDLAERVSNDHFLDRKCVAYIYDVSLSNISKSELTDWKLTVTMNDAAYINSAWCGKVVINQASSGESQLIDLRDYKLSDINLDYVQADGDLMIPLAPGDTFEYLPNPDVFEMPLDSVNYRSESEKSIATIGFIVYFPSDEWAGKEPTITNLSIDYHLSYKLIRSPYVWALILAVLIWIMSGFIMLFTEIKTRQFEKQRAKDELIINETMHTFTGFIDAKDPYTRGHSMRVAEYSRKIAEQLNMSEEECENVYRVAQLHDSGKIGIPEGILNKAGKLNDEEFEVIKSHTVKGYDILLNMSSLPDAPLGARYHHERYDGTGYPDGLKGASIPMVARIISVADAFDAMNSDRCYRNKLPYNVIIEQLKENRGTQFDPILTDIILELIESGSIKI